MNAARSRRGFTLVELLVVVGLLAALFALVAGGLTRPNMASSVKRTAQDLASRLLAVQSRALGKPEGAALIIAPDAANARLGTMVLDAVTHPWVTVASGSGMPPENPRQTSVAVEVTASALSLDADELRTTAYKIRYQTAAGGGQVSPSASPWFAFLASSASQVSGTCYMAGTVRFRGSAGQTLANTIWPKTPKQAEQAVIARYPTPGGSGAPMSKQVAVDLKHSGVGETQSGLNGYGQFEGKGSIAVAYDHVGRIGEVMRNVQEPRTSADQPIEPTGVIYFLVVPRDDVLFNRNTLANAQAVWVAINSQTGRVTVAENIPQAAEDADAVAAARANARAGAAMK